MGSIDWFEGWRPEGGAGGKPLSDIVASATRVRCSSPLEDKTLYTTKNRDEIAALAAALRTELPPDKQGSCMCFGTIVFELEGPREMRVTLHHGKSLRWGGTDEDVALLDPDALMEWLSARGMGFVRDEYEADRRRTEETAAQVRRWRAALPASMVPFFDRWCNGTDDDGDGDDDWPRLTAALEAELPDPIARARVLLELFGSGAGPWSGTPLYELDPERLLLHAPLPVLLAAIGDAPDERRREGAARLFSSPDFRRARAADCAKLPEDLRQLLLAHAEASPDKDKRLRARAALGRR